MSVPLSTFVNGKNLISESFSARLKHEISVTITHYENILLVKKKSVKRFVLSFNDVWVSNDYAK